MTSSDTSPAHFPFSNFNNSNSEDNQITFINYTHSYCVCIIDIVNSTKNTQDLGNPEKIRSYYSIFLNTMASIIKDYGGKVIKNVGDNLLYYFPKTVDPTNESAFQDVFECGLAMIGSNSLLNSKLFKEKLPSISYRISGNYGKVEVALTYNSNSIDIFGSTVNLCSKINHLALPNGMVIGRDLYDVIVNASFTKDYCFKKIVNHDNNEDKQSFLAYSICNTDELLTQVQIKDKKRQIRIKEQENEEGQDNSSFNLLIIDDDKDILFTFKTILKIAGYSIDTFSDPYKALENFSSLDPYYYDLVILDIRMPGLNGIQLYNSLKIMNPETKVLFLSALDAANELLSIFPNLHPRDIIRKPVEHEQLVAKIKSILKKSN